MARKIQGGTCEDCGKEFNNKHGIFNHKKRMHKEKYKDFLEKCDICNFYAENKSALKDHVLRKHQENSVVCELCKVMFTFKTDLKMHKMRKHNEDGDRKPAKKKECEECGESFGDVFKHKLTIHRDKYKQLLVKCDICAYETYGKTGLDIHNKRKHQEKSILCNICNKAFAMKVDLDIHHINKHTVERPFQCKQCPSSFKRSCALSLHKRTVHVDGKNYQCNVCLKAFKNATSVKKCLENHEKGDQKIPCPLPGCEVTVKNPYLVRPHLRYHEQKKVKGHTCCTCYKAFGAKSDLTRHIRNVHIKPEKQFQCKECPTKCISLKKLESHSKIHEGKLFPCTVEGCSTKSNTQYGINFHIKKKHGVISHRDDFVPIEKRPSQTCELCGAVLKPSLSPLHTMKLHMKTHENKLHLTCLVDDCDAMIKECVKVTYKPPEIWFNHLWHEHAISPEYIEALFDCNKCFHVVKINFAVVRLNKLKDLLKNHLTSAHKDLLSLNFRLGDQWNQFYTREIKLKDLFQKTLKVNIDKLSVQHYRNQSKERTCSICSKVFIKEGNLNNHLEWHEERGDIEVKTNSRDEHDANIVDVAAQITEALELQIQNNLYEETGENNDEDKVLEVLEKIPNDINDDIAINNESYSTDGDWYLED